MAGDDRGVARIPAAQRDPPRVEAEARLRLVAAVTLDAALLEDRPDVAGEVDGADVDCRTVAASGPDERRRRGSGERHEDRVGDSAASHAAELRGTRGAGEVTDPRSHGEEARREVVGLPIGKRPQRTSATIDDKVGRSLRPIESARVDPCGCVWMNEEKAMTLKWIVSGIA